MRGNSRAQRDTRTEEGVTEILARIVDGDDAAYDKLLPLIYSELRTIARSLMKDERDDHTLQTTALVNEACIRLMGLQHVEWKSRMHFLRVAARAMRRVLVDSARERNARKRGGRVRRLSVDAIETEVAAYFGYPKLDVIALDISLDRMSKVHPRQAKVVELLFFAGLTGEEAAETMDVTRRTVVRDWRHARAWLIRDMERATGVTGMRA
ncbi:MAG: RNA polymerase subunit sigma-70 [Candidatus Latescibacteria bacterium]|nr:RNA polymerase subunit sigma-70 [Candidatus Latescibacterota bacterium]